VNTFHAMGCEIAVSGASHRELEAVKNLFRVRDQTFSRFISDSELNRVNRLSGALVHVSEGFARMLRLALDAASETSGLVVPTLGAALEAAGYDRDFELLALAPEGEPATVEPSAASVRLLGRIVSIPPGVKLDLNGVVKGQTVDDALALLGGRGFVSAGGDLATRGPVVVSLPRGGSVELLRGAIATSGSDRRQWYRDGTRRHHLIDPRTGAPSTSAWEQVTVCASTCVGADIAAKAAFLLGDGGPEWLDGRGLPGRFVETGGELVVNRRWCEMLEAAVACT
jgi:FAD:protein FMN transferase